MTPVQPPRVWRVEDSGGQRSLRVYRQRLART